jgi:predicted nucleic acid-binding Zn ribbon protein
MLLASRMPPPVVTACGHRTDSIAECQDKALVTMRHASAAIFTFLNRCLLAIAPVA